MGARGSAQARRQASASDRLRGEGTQAQFPALATPGVLPHMAFGAASKPPVKLRVLVQPSCLCRGA